MGDLPPYEAFVIGGNYSVRGYSDGGVGTGRNYATGTTELRFPLWKKSIEVNQPETLSKQALRGLLITIPPYPTRSVSCCTLSSIINRPLLAWLRRMKPVGAEDAFYSRGSRLPPLIRADTWLRSWWQGSLFADGGTDFGSGASVKGDPAGARGKPGSGCV